MARPVTFDGDKSPRESGDKSPHSKGCAVEQGHKFSNPLSEKLASRVSIRRQTDAARSPARGVIHFSVASNAATTGRWSEPSPQFGIVGM